MIISKKKYEEELNRAYEKGRTECQEHFWSRQEQDGLRQDLARLMDRVEKLENKGRKPRFHCPHLNAINFRG